MRVIDLGNGQRTIVDDVAYEIFGHLPWRAARNGRTAHTYAICSLRDPVTGKPLRLHHAVARLAAVPGTGPLVDHVNASTLDNRASNLRFCTAFQNSSSRGRSPGRTYQTPYLGVTLDRKGRFVAQIQVNRRTIRIGTFTDAVDAAIARDRVARRLRGAFARVNFAVDPGGALLSRVDPNRSNGKRRAHPYDVAAVMRGP